MTWNLCKFDLGVERSPRISSNEVLTDGVMVFVKVGCLVGDDRGTVLLVWRPPVCLVNLRHHSVLAPSIVVLLFRDVGSSVSLLLGWPVANWLVPLGVVVMNSVALLLLVIGIGGLGSVGAGLRVPDCAASIGRGDVGGLGRGCVASLSLG